MNLCDLNAVQLSEMLSKREISSTEITLSVLDRISEKEEIINSYITVLSDLALQQAKKADKRIQTQKDMPLLCGIPIAVKDNICTEGVLTTCGSKMLKNYLPPYDATVIEKIKRENAVIIGKTNLDEFGMGSSTEKSINGATRNPKNLEYVAGGSSGGSAAAVAAGETVLALGSDTGGSVRMPAAYCGVTGIKPTYGAVSRYGLVSYASSLDQIGAIGKTVEDCAILLSTISGYDAKDSTSAKTKHVDYLAQLNQDIDGLKIGLPKEYFTEGLNKEVSEKINLAVQYLEQNGAEIVEISLPHTRYAISTYYLIATAEASSNLARYDGVKFGYRTHDDISDLSTMYKKSRSEGFGKEVKRRIMLGSYVLSAGYFDAYYLKAQKVRTLIKQDFENAFEQIDCIISPVTPSTAFKLGEKTTDPLQMYLEDIYTVSVNLAGLPSISINCGEVKGLPVGFQIIGKPFDEQKILQIGNFYEKTFVASK